MGGGALHSKAQSAHPPELHLENNLLAGTGKSHFGHRFGYLSLAKARRYKEKKGPQDVQGSKAKR